MDYYCDAFVVSPPHQTSVIFDSTVSLGTSAQSITFLFGSRENSRTSDRSFGAKQLSLDQIPAEKSPRAFHWFSSPWKVEQPMLWQPNATCLYAVTGKGPLQGHSQPVGVIAVLVNGWHSQHIHPVMKRQISACFSSISGTASLVSALPLLTVAEESEASMCSAQCTCDEPGSGTDGTHSWGVIKTETSALILLSGITWTPHRAQLSNLAKYLTTSRRLPLECI